MSYSQIPINVLQSLDCVTDLNAPLEYVVQKGGGSDNYYTRFSVSSGQPSVSQNTFNINPNSPGVIVDRRMYLDNTYDITLTATNNTTSPHYVYQPGISGCIRQFAIMNSIKSLSISLNDQTFSTNVNEYISAMYKYMSDDLKEFELSISPSMDDKFQNYADGQGSNLNPLALYGNSGNGVPTRGGFNIQITSNNLIGIGTTQGITGTAVLRVRIVEPMMISPLWFGKGSPKGLIGMQTMTVNYVYDNGAKSIWCQAQGPNIPALTTTPWTGPTSGVLVSPVYAYVWVLQYTPRQLEVTPQQLAWPYTNLVNYSSQLTPIPVWSQAGPTFQLNNPGTPYVAPSCASVTIGGINLSTIPERLYIFARPQNADISGNAYVSNTFGVINQVTITWDGRNLLSQCYDSQVYEYCRANGCNQNYTAFSNYEGSVITVDFAKQIGCGSLQAPGLLSRSVLSVTANIINTNGGIVGAPSPAVTNYILYVVVCEGGIAGSIDNHVIKQVGLLSSQDVLNSDSAPFSYDHRDMTVFGSSFLSDLYSGFKRGVGSVYNAAKHIPGIIGTASSVYNAVKPFLGHGMSGGRSRSRSRSHSRGRGLSGGRKRSRSRSHSKGRGLSGGRKRSRSRSHRMHGAGLEENVQGGKMIKRSDLLNRK